MTHTVPINQRPYIERPTGDDADGAIGYVRARLDAAYKGLPPGDPQTTALLALAEANLLLCVRITEACDQLEAMCDRLAGMSTVDTDQRQ